MNNKFALVICQVSEIFKGEYFAGLKVNGMSGHLLVVRVPVLSEQMAVALPMVSQASKCLTKLLSNIIFCNRFMKLVEIKLICYNKYVSEHIVWDEKMIR